MTTTLELSLLGKIEVRWNRQPVDGFKTNKALALLCYVAVTQRRHRRTAMAQFFWGGDTPDLAQNSLRVALSHLNQLLPGVLEITPETIAFHPDLDLVLDVDSFASKTRTLESETIDIDLLGEAVALYRGDFVEDFYIDDAPAFEEWLVGERQYWRQTMLEALRAFAVALLAQRQFEAAAQTLSKLLAMEPWDEEAHRTLMRTFCHLGDFNRALAQYEICRRTLAVELDVMPTAETVALYKRVQSVRHTPADMLPEDSTPFIGREHELVTVGTLLADPTCRLVTIVGLGGMGKTRLALQAARQAARQDAILFPDGVVFVPLASVDLPDLVPSALADALALPLVARSDPMQPILDYLRKRELLLVLDNFEHLQAAAVLVARLLNGAPSVKLLVTSRTPLAIDGERCLFLEGLAYPVVEASIDDSRSYAAVDLFALAARQVRPDFKLTATDAPYIHRLCRLLAGVPLALTLAAPWLRVMPIARIVAEIESSLDLLTTRLRDLPLRQRSLRVVLAYVWDMLNEREQQTVYALALFGGGCDAQAALHVAGADAALLASFVERGLLQPLTAGDARYHMYEPMRQYVLEHLASLPALANQLRDRHSAYFLARLQGYQDGIHGPRQRAVIAAISVDLENIRLAWQRAIHNGDGEALFQAAAPLQFFYDARGYYRQGVDSIQAAIQAVEVLPHATARSVLAHLHLHAGWAYIRLGELERARTALLCSQALYDELAAAPPPGFGTDPLVGLSVLANIAGDYDVSIAWGEAARRRSEQSGDRANLSNALSALAGTARTRGQHELALVYTRRAYELAEEQGNWWFAADLLNDLGDLAQALNDEDLAEQHYQASYGLKQEFSDPEGMALALDRLADLAYRRADYGAAHELYLQNLVTYQRIHNRGGLVMTLTGLGNTCCAQGAHAEAQRHFFRALRVGLEIGAPRLILATAVGIGDLLCGLGDVDLAIELFAVVVAHPATDRAARITAQKRLDMLLPAAPAALFANADMPALVDTLLCKLSHPLLGL